MNKRMSRIGCACAFLCSFAAQAGRFDVVPLKIDNPVYTGFAASYGTVEVKGGESDWVAGGKFYLGYRMTEQWAVELSGRRSGDLDAGYSVGNDGVEPNFGVGLSLLGFANYREFSAYYRLGLEYSDYTLLRYASEADPANQCLTLSAGGYRCEVDESEVAAIFGLGYEVMVTEHVGYRLEWESQWGGSDLNQHAIYLGVQFAF